MSKAPDALVTFPVITTSRQCTESRVYCGSWYQKHRSPARQEGRTRAKHSSRSRILSAATYAKQRAHTGSRERPPTLKAQPQ